MKKALMTLVAVCLAATSFAQTSSGRFSLDETKIYYGARLGLSASGVTDAGSKAGLTLGGVVGLRLSDSAPVFIESGLAYTQRGGKKDGFTTNLNYLEIPILIKYGIPVVDGVHVLPLLGPTSHWQSTDVSRTRLWTSIPVLSTPTSTQIWVSR